MNNDSFSLSLFQPQIKYIYLLFLALTFVPLLASIFALLHRFYLQFICLIETNYEKLFQIYHIKNSNRPLALQDSRMKYYQFGQFNSLIVEIVSLLGQCFTVNSKFCPENFDSTFLLIFRLTSTELY